MKVSLTRPVKGRMAPTPSGYLHAGNVCNFMLNWLLVRHLGGKLRLRIDDLDQTRMRPEYLDDIFRVLDWLGMDWDEGPQSPDDHLRSFSQKYRLAIYQKHLADLRSAGHLFACTCSRKQVRQLSPDGRYPGTCLGLGRDFEGPQTAWRLQTLSVTSQTWEDLCGGSSAISPHEAMPFVVLRRKDGIPAYQIGTVVDDHLDGITHVIRGEDLRPSTAIQLYISGLLGKDLEAIQWGHHGLLRDALGEKQSKSAGQQQARSLLDLGIKPKTLFYWIAEGLGIPNKPDKLQTLLQAFSLDHLARFRMLPLSHP